MRSLERDELTIHASQPSPDSLRLDWRGRSAFRRPEEIFGPYLDAVLVRARDRSADIEMHFEDLDYLNSSTVAVLVRFLRQVRGEGLGISFMYRANVRWQRLSFDALRVFQHLDPRVRVVSVSDRVESLQPSS